MAINGPVDLRWWLLKGGDQAVTIYDIVSKLVLYDSDRNGRNLRALRLYGNSDLTAVGPFSAPWQSSTTLSMPDSRLKINIVSSMCDTVSAKISKMRPKVTFLTSGATFNTQRRAQDLTKFMQGLFYRNKIHSLHQVAFKDATILDIGALKHYIDGKNIVSERVLATELYCDPIDAMYGKPQSLYQVKYIHRDVLKARFPKKAGIIQLAKSTFDDVASMSQQELSNYVAVIEAWHLPSGADAGDGCHTICVSNDVLMTEEYKRNYFPFTFMRWSSRIVGWFGQSLAERLMGSQLEINRMLRTIQQSFHLGSAFKVFLEHGSRVAKDQLNSEIGSIIYYSGTKPEFYVPQTVHPEYFQHLNFLIQSAYEEAGISQLSATSRKPAGIDSGKALREYNELETERFAIVSQDYEATFLDTAHQYIDLVKEMHDDGVNLEVTAESKKFLQTIKWSEVAVDTDDFIMQMFPSSSLPSTPAGKLQYVQELVNTGYIEKEFALKLLDFPDLESYTDLVNAPLDDLLNNIQEIMDGDYSPPEPYQDLNLGIKLFQSAYLKARRLKAPDNVLENLRTWMSTAEAMLSESTMQQQAQVAPQQPPQPPQSTPPALPPA